MFLQPSNPPEDCATEKSGFSKFKEASRRVAISIEGWRSRAASGSPSFPGVGGVSEIIYYGRGEGGGESGAGLGDKAVGGPQWTVPKTIHL